MSLHEVIDSRVLGALRLIENPTQTVVRRMMNVSAENTTFIRNRSWHYVINSTAGLEHHTGVFSTPPELPPLSDLTVEIKVTDPMNCYLPRITTIALPRDPDPDHAHQPNSLFRPVAVQLYATPAFPMHPNWSGIRASVTIAGSAEEPIAGALLRIIKNSDDSLLARGYSDSRGEVLVIIPGIPITSFNSVEDDAELEASGPVIISETAVRVEVVVNPAMPWPVDPDVLEANRASWIRNSSEPILMSLRTGKIETVSIEVDLT